jgi:uncharacterized membrane-anchored protein
MDYVVGNPLARISSSEQPTVKRFAGQVDIQSTSPSKTQSKYLNQGQSWAEEERKKQQEMLDAQAAGETGGTTVSLGDYGQLQLK